MRKSLSALVENHRSRSPITLHKRKNDEGPGRLQSSVRKGLDVHRVNCVCGALSSDAHIASNRDFPTCALFKVAKESALTSLVVDVHCGYDKEAISAADL